MEQVGSLTYACCLRLQRSKLHQLVKAKGILLSPCSPPSATKLIQKYLNMSWLSTVGTGILYCPTSPLIPIKGLVTPHWTLVSLCPPCRSMLDHGDPRRDHAFAFLLPFCCYHSALSAPRPIFVLSVHRAPEVSTPLRQRSYLRSRLDMKSLSQRRRTPCAPLHAPIFKAPATGA